MGLFRKKVTVTLPASAPLSSSVTDDGRRTGGLLFTSEELPPGFAYPPGLLRLVEAGLFELGPWWILTGDHLRALNTGMAKRYPKRHLLLFAKRQDTDDCVCFDMDTGKVSRVHDWASPGWEAKGEFPDFNSWLHSAIDDPIEF